MNQNPELLTDPINTHKEPRVIVFPELFEILQEMGRKVKIVPDKGQKVPFLELGDSRCFIHFTNGSRAEIVETEVQDTDKQIDE